MLAVSVLTTTGNGRGGCEGATDSERRALPRAMVVKVRATITCQNETRTSASSLSLGR